MTVVSHDPTSHINAHLDCLDIRNVVVPLMMQMASCDAKTIGSGMT